MITRGWLPCRWLACLLLAPGLALASPLAYIPNGVSGTVSVIDTGTNTVKTTIPVGLGAVGVAVNATGTRVYIANISFNFVSVIDTTTDTVVATVNVGNSPTGISVNSAGTRVYVCNGDDNTVSVIDTATNTVIATVAVGAYPGGLVVGPAGTRIYVANLDAGTVSVIDAGTNKIVATVTVGATLEMIAVNPAGTRLYVTTDLDTVSVIDTATDHPIASVAVGSGPFGIAVNPDGTRVYVANNVGNNVSVIDTESNAVVATVAVGAGPVGIAVNPGGTRVYVTNSGSNNVSAIDTTSNSVVATIAVGIFPTAIGQFIGPDTAAASNYQGLWWKADESGWGVNFAHQGDLVFATWYTYDTAGNAYWLSMLGTRASATSNAYSGDVNVNVGPPFNNFVGSGSPSKVGTGTVTFTDANNGTFAYQLSAGGAANIDQSKPITRFNLGGAQPTCTYSASANLTGATNYQDLWWVPTESGWGVNFAHQGNLLFATWYTYDAKVAGNNAPLWLSALLAQGAGGVFIGPITRTSGPRFDNYKASDVVQPIPTVGTATVTFTDGNHASFHYITNGTGGLPAADQTKSITRFLFSANGATTCQ